jgi:ribonuclease J
MRICVHRGTREIGGTCVEVQAQGKRMVLDVGLPLTTNEAVSDSLPPVAGFKTPDPSLLGVVISHPHQDHYGLAARLPRGTPFLIGEAADRILRAAADFSPAGATLDLVDHLRDRQPINLPPFTITPYLVDHSAYDSYALMVEAEGRRLFYTGDLRAHGRKAGLYERLVDDPPAGVDVLLIEGTTIGRPDATKPAVTEDDLVARFMGLFEAPGLSLVWASGQNIDRLVTLYKACRRSGREMVIDAYTAHVLRATGNDRIPQASWPGIRVFLPFTQRSRIIADEAFHLVNPLRPHRIFPEEIAREADRLVMLFRPSMTGDLDRIEGLRINRLIHSLWPGYLTEGRNDRLLAWLRGRGIAVSHCHTSGHASPADLARLRRAFPSATAIPVHTESAEAAASLFDQPVRVLSDGEWLELASE